MTNLVVRRGLRKLAAAVDGPSFETQFGILANAQVADKYPKLDKHKLAFQLIDKDDDNTKAVGASVYVLGKSVIFIPCFFMNGAVTSTEMMFLAQTQQFLPLSDPWLSWVQNKDLNDAGEVVDDRESAFIENERPGNATTIKQFADPIIKTASVYLKGLLRTDPDLRRPLADVSILDTALEMGKTASASLMDHLIEDRRFLNATLRFYDGDSIDAFAKKAAALGAEDDPVKVVVPFSEEARSLTPDEKAAMDRDGYVIKTAAEGPEPEVVREFNVKDSFEVLSRPGRRMLLEPDGTMSQHLVLRDGGHLFRCDHVMPQGAPEEACRSYASPGMTASKVMRSAAAPCGMLALVTKGETPRLQELPDNTMVALGDGNDDFTPEMLSQYGKPATPAAVDGLKYGDFVACPDGKAYRIAMDVYSHNDGWYSALDGYAVYVGKDARQTSPVVTTSCLILPKGSRIFKDPRPDPVKRDEVEKASKNIHVTRFVTWSTFEPFLAEYRNRHYKRLKLTSNGTEASVDGGEPMSVKEASVKLVKDYGVSPAMARTMVAEVCAQSSPGVHGSGTFYISKTAGVDDPWKEADIGANEFRNEPPKQEWVQMPTVLEDPERLRQVVETAAEDGIKEVFDVTAFKILIRDNRFLEEIHDDMPLFMRVLDSLCRKLFLLYWHTDEFEKEYGAVKLKALEGSLKNTLDSLSDIVVFFKLRTVDGSLGVGNDGGELSEGHSI